MKIVIGGERVCSEEHNNVRTQKQVTLWLGENGQV
jgi:hypothetical protein